MALIRLFFIPAKLLFPRERLFQPPEPPEAGRSPSGKLQPLDLLGKTGPSGLASWASRLHSILEFCVEWGREGRESLPFPIPRGLNLAGTRRA